MHHRGAVSHVSTLCTPTFFFSIPIPTESLQYTHKRRLATGLMATFPLYTGRGRGHSGKQHGRESVEEGYKITSVTQFQCRRLGVIFPVISHTHTTVRMLIHSKRGSSILTLPIVLTSQSMSRKSSCSPASTALPPLSYTSQMLDATAELTWD